MAPISSKHIEERRENMEERVQCVICNGKLEFLLERVKYPITASPPQHVFAEDRFADQRFMVCPQCSCVQLGTLIDPEYLYGSSHNNTSHTHTWKEHHRAFANFLGKTDRILEIGGSGILYPMLSDRMPSLQYACLDICDPIDSLPGITYLKGNCETFAFPEKSSLVMSHIFEHLYHPRKFLENVRGSLVDSVYISIPNMFQMLQNNMPYLLHNEHTYYIDRYLLEWLFLQCGFVLAEFYEFQHHSLFFHFRRKEDATQPYVLESRPHIVEQIHASLRRDDLRFQHVTIQPNSFVIPAGLFGQFFYYSCASHNLLGFLDNDPSKQNRRVYGTPHWVFPFSKLAEYDACTVYVFAGPYTAEIVRQLQGISSTVEIVEV